MHNMVYRQVPGESPKPLIVLIGPSSQEQGGIVSVIQRIQSSCLSDEFDFIWHASYQGTRRGAKALSFFRNWCHFVRLAMRSRRQISAIHIHTASKGSTFRKVVYTLTAHAFKLRTILHIHGGYFLQQRQWSPLSRWLVDTSLKFADEVVVLSPSWASKVHDFMPDKSVNVIPNCVDVHELSTAALLEKKPDRIRVLFLGRLVEDKGLKELFLAAQELSQSAAFEFYICGPGDIPYWKDFASRLGVEQQVHFTGWIDGQEKRQLLGSSDIFVLPSYVEAQPLSLLEAMGLGIPSIATTVGTIPEIIDDGVNGLLVQPRDVSGLARQMLRLAHDRPLRDTLGRQARATVEAHYDCRNQDNKFRDLYTR